MRILFAIIPMCLILAGCGDSKVREFRGEFIEGCMSTSEKTSAKRAMCNCVFDKMQDRYSRDQLLGIRTGDVPNDFSNFIPQAMLSCLKENL